MHRLVLTGTPMQNNLQELWALFSFVEPGLLGELEFFTKKFCQVILKGGYTGASQFEQETARQATEELRSLI
jgi:DNA excision repair protein ERCC-6